MKWIYNFFSFFSVLGLLSSCVQTRTLTSDNQKLNELNRPDYIGTFSAIYFIDSLRSVRIDPAKTLNSIYRNDSLIRKRVKFLSFSTQKVDTSNSVAINKELVACLNYTKNKKTIKGYNGSLNEFKKISKTTTSNYNVYFISTGYTKNKKLSEKELEMKVLNGSLAALSAFAFGGTGVIFYAGATKNIFSPKYVTDTNSIYYDGAFKKKQGLSGFVIVYDKVKNEICYVREQFFSSSKNPLDLKSVKKQVKNAFKEIYF